MKKPPTYPPLYPYLGGQLAQGKLVIDCFAGWGGASTGIEAAIGRPVDHAINHDRTAVDMHRVNHPHSHHSVEDVWNVHPLDITNGQPVGLLWASPTCFPAGALVLTAAGYRAIEDVQVGDLVLTHKSRWRRVTHTMQAQKATRTLAGFGHPGLTTTHEHPFWVAERPSKYQMKLAPAQWVEAGKIEARKHYWALPKGAQALPVPEVGGRGMTINAQLLWLAGRYVADGYATLTDLKSEIMIACGNDKLEATRARLDIWPRTGERAGFNELAWGEIAQEGAVRLFTTHRGLTEWLVSEFGKLAHTKRLPGWLYGLSESERQAFLDGYLSGDGWKGGNIIECSTVSRELAFGLKTLLGTLGHAAAMYHAPQRNNVIAGRTVNVRDVYTLKWRAQLDQAHRQHGEDDSHLFTRIRKITDSPEVVTVYNISVEEDETYVVDGVVVHNCTHFSKAKGAALLDRKIRGLAWMVMPWVHYTQPDVIVVENVEEFQGWGPLTPEGRPDPKHTGRTFNSWVNALRTHGYAVEWRELRACDYGSPTIRKRLFVIARRDGLPIVWPQPTHAAPTDARVKAGVLEPYRTAASCIDWAIPCPSIFTRKKPLVRNTLNRVAQGLRRFVLESDRPFIVTANHGGEGFRGQPLDQPFNTIVAAHEAHGLTRPVLAPCVVNKQHGNPARSADAPLSTVTTNTSKNEVAVAHLVQHNGGSLPPADASYPVDRPARTVLAQGGPQALVSGALIGIDNASSTGSNWSAEQALTTIVTEARHALVSGALVACGGRGAQARPKAINETMHTITSKADMCLTTAHLTAYYGCDGKNDDSRDASTPMGTIPTRDRFSVTAATLMRQFGTSTAADITAPAPTVMTEGAGKTGVITTTASAALTPEQLTRAQQVAAFLLEYLGDAVLPYLRDGLIVLQIRGEWYILADIGMRMLTPRELASCQGFPETYELERTAEGQVISKARQVRGIGNSVCPQVAEQIVRAQLGAQMQEAAD